MDRYPITSQFMAQESFRQKAHLGLDFSMVNNTPLRTIQNGIIERVINVPDGIGKAVFVKWSDGNTAIYGHMSNITVKTGDRVKMGDLLGYSGNTGNVFGENGGYHLHFAIKDSLGRYIDPEPYAPFIQAMNHDLVYTIASSENGLVTISNDATEILRQTIDHLINAIQAADINMIFVSLFSSPAS